MRSALLSEFIIRDLKTLKKEIQLYNNPEDLWITGKGISNSAGNLCLHLIGNLNHFVGHCLGNTGYHREREKEFTDKNVPREKLLNDLDNLIPIIDKTLSDLSDADLLKNFPLEKHGETVSTEHMLMHLLAHLNYHLGQVNYHRRLLSS